MREMRMEMRSGQRWIIGILLAWPPLLITAMPRRPQMDYLT